MKKLFKSGLFWTFIFGISSTILAVLLFFWSKEERSPVYYIKGEPRLIFDKDHSSSSITVLSKDSIEVDDNIFVSNIVIWNDGTLEIKKSDIRQEISIRPSVNSKILDYRIVKENTPGISNFVLHEENDRLVLNWDFFDPQFACEVQIMFTGEKNSPPEISGYVLGGKMRELEDIEPHESLQILFFFLLPYAIPYSFILMILFFLDKRKHEKKWSWYAKIEIGLGLTLVILMAVVGYNLSEMIRNMFLVNVPL